MKYIFSLLVSQIFTTSILAQKLSIELDLSNANKMIEMFKNDALSESEINGLLKLESSKALLRKLNANDSIMTQALIKASNGSGKVTKKESYFQYDEIKENLRDLTVFIKKLKTNTEIIEARLKEALSYYLPQNKNVNIKVVGIIGGHSTGYTFGDGNTFYISLHHMSNDFDHFIEFCKHELFHNLQAIWFDNKEIFNALEKTEKTSPDYYSYYIFNSLYNEGTATYLDDFDEMQIKPSNKDWIGRYRKNEKREQRIFWMFDHLMVEFQKSYSGTNINHFYNTFFTTQFDEAGYYLGSVIASYLLKDKSKKKIKSYLGANPMKFISDYINLSKNDKNAPYHFSDEFERVVSNLSKRVSSY